LFPITVSLMSLTDGVVLVSSILAAAARCQYQQGTHEKSILKQLAMAMCRAPLII